MSRLLTALITVVAATGAAIALVELSHWLLVRWGRRSVLAADLARTAHRPFLATMILFAVQQALRAAGGSFTGRAVVLHALVILFIATFAWLVGALVLVLEDVALARWRTDVPDNLRRRRFKTQVVILRRVSVAAIVVLALGVALMTFPSIRALGASVLASAGLVSVIAALAAQSTLGNVFAGLQLAFSDAVRVDDVVVVEGEWGRIEELTLTYVAVQIWDDRRLLLPTSYFTTKPFENWTRTGSAVLGTAELDVDWSVPVEPMRAELRTICEGTDLWDGRVCVLQVTDAVGGTIRLRALVSAADAPSLWDLRCLVRERLVGWVWERRRDALPRVRNEVGAPHEAGGATRPFARTGHGAPGDGRVFSGGDDGEARGAAFAGPDGDGEARGVDGEARSGVDGEARGVDGEARGGVDGEARGVDGDGEGRGGAGAGPDGVPGVSDPVATGEIPAGR